MNMLAWLGVAFGCGALFGMWLVRPLRRRRPATVLGEPDRTCQRLGPRGVPHA